MKVLVPLDGTKETLQAMENGLRLLKGSKADVHLLCVRTEGFGDDTDRAEMFAEDADDQIFATDDEAQTMLGEAAALCKKVGFTATTKVVEGNIQKSILDEAASADLLLMHQLGAEQVKEKIRMSNMEALVRKVDCAVLLA